MVATRGLKADAVNALHTSSASANEVPVELNKKHEPSASDQPGRHKGPLDTLADRLTTADLAAKQLATFSLPGGPDGSSPNASQLCMKSVHTSLRFGAD
jgi:hypothetical protein